MKIVLEDKVYVQLNDLAHMMKFLNGRSVPVSVFDKVFGEVFVCTDSNRYDFVEFNTQEEIEFFKDLEYSVDYMECKDLTDKELIAKGQSIADELNELADKFNSLTEEEKANNTDIVDRHGLLEFKMYSVRDVIFYKQGKLKMKMPKEVSIKKETPKVKGVEEVKKENGLKKLINKIRRR